MYKVIKQLLIMCKYVKVHFLITSSVISWSKSKFASLNRSPTLMLRVYCPIRWSLLLESFGRLSFLLFLKLDMKRSSQSLLQDLIVKVLLTRLAAEYFPHSICQTQPISSSWHWFSLGRSTLGFTLYGHPSHSSTPCSKLILFL